MKAQHEGYAIEAALEAGFVFTNAEGTSFGCTEEAIQKFASYARSELIKEIERLREANERMVRALNAISCQDADCKDDGVVWCAQRARTALEEKE